MSDAEADGPKHVSKAARKARGAFPTPWALVETVVDGVMPEPPPRREVTVVDPACGDGRFLVQAARAIHRMGAACRVVGMDIDPAAAAEAERELGSLTAEGIGISATIRVGDALTSDWLDGSFDVVLGNPPYLSQLSARSTRGGVSKYGGGAYADVAAEFLALSVRLARPAGGRVGLVLPQSILGSRDVGPIRAAVERDAVMCWSWFSPRRHFDAEVVVCALGFERRANNLSTISCVGNGNGNGNGNGYGNDPVWTHVVTDALGVPALPSVATQGTFAERVRSSANFRDQYYGLVPAVADHESGPPLITSGLIDPAGCRWGQRPVTFQRRRFERPRVDLDQLSVPMRTWAADLLVPKVLVANQTRVIECVVDVDGAWLPAVPVVTARPRAGVSLWDVAAVLTSPLASVWAWHRAAGTGLSARSLRVGPRLMDSLPWPTGPLDDAVESLRAGDVHGCGWAVGAAFGIESEPGDELYQWWLGGLP